MSQLGFFRGTALRGGKSIKRVFIRLAYTPPQSSSPAIDSHWRGYRELVTTQSITCRQNTHIHKVIKFRKVIFKT